MLPRLPALAAALPLLVAAAPPSPAAPTTAHAAMARLSADYDAFDARWNPVGAGRDGDRAALSRLPDPTAAAAQARRRELVVFQARLKTPALAHLGGEDALNREIMAYEVDEAVAGIDGDEARLNFDSYGGFHLFTGQLAQGTALRTREDAQAYLARLRALPAWYAAEIDNARRGAATGFTQPRPTVLTVLQTARTIAAIPAGEDALLKPFATRPAAIPAAEWDALRGQALALVRDGVKRAQASAVAFLETEYLPKARASLAARDLPGGEAWYRRQVRLHTTTDLTPDEIHALGEREVTRIRDEMQAVIARAGFRGSFADWQAYLRRDPRFYVTSGETLLERSARFDKRVDDALPRFFGRLPRLTFAVRPIPAESAEGATTAYYQPGAPKLGIAGGYMVNLTHLDQRPTYEIPALSLHESVPGHHLQIALAQELEGQPRFRREGYYDAFGEGWGLYAERLGVEMGLYATPEEDFGRLSYEMWRACRLVADTGIHWLRWTREQARACFTDNTALSAKNIDVELDRYISWPGQALAYKIGQLKLLELRARAEAALGPRFDVRRFHDAVLLDGALPLNVLERKIDAWIASEKARAP